MEEDERNNGMIRMGSKKHKVLSSLPLIIITFSFIIQFSIYGNAIPNRAAEFDIYFPQPDVGEYLINFSIEDPNEGDEVVLTVTILSSAEEEINVTISFFDGHPSGNDLIGFDLLALTPGASGTGSIIWNTSGEPEFHTIYAVIDHDNNISETNEENNVILSDIRVNMRPIANAGSFVNGTYFEDDPLTFDGSRTIDTNYDLDRGLVFRWTFDDPYSNSSNPNTVEGLNLTDPVHTFTKKGDYNVWLDVIDSNGARGTDIVEILIENKAPIAIFHDNIVGYMNDTLVLDASNSTDTDSDKPFLEYFWNISENDDQEGKITEIKFSEAGNYTARLRVIDDDLEESIFSFYIRILELLTVESLEISIDEVKEDLEVREIFIITGMVDVTINYQKAGLDPIEPIVDIRIEIHDTDLSWATVTNLNGQFLTTIQAPEQVGQYEIIINASYMDSSTEMKIAINVEEAKETGSSFSISTPAAIATTSTVVTFTLLGALIGLTDIGRYSFFTLFVPLYSRLRKEKVLDHFTRGKIYGFILSNPGVHFSFVKKELKVNNGNLAYHLRVLEREGYLKSRREGVNRCFYPTELPYPKMVGGELVNKNLDQTTERILDEIEENPNLTQSELMRYTGIGRSTLSRKLNALIDMNLINIERDGNEKRYSLNENAIERYKVCPFCGKKLKLVTTPHYCPYCKRKIIFSDDS